VIREWTVGIEVEHLARAPRVQPVVQMSQPGLLIRAVIVVFDPARDTMQPAATRAHRALIGTSA
jgi:hypothetical protein